MCADLRNVPDGLLRHANESGDELAFRTIEGETWTWRDYLERAARFAGGCVVSACAPETGSF